jgi:ATP-dependent Clp protease ATP-binding subunit ClpC
VNYNFTDRVRKVLAFAREEAIRMRHDYIGTEHILLGLVREGQGIATAILERFRVTSVLVRDNVESMVRHGKSTVRANELPYTSRAKKVLEFSVQSAKELRHDYVGTEHVLLGLLREEKGSPHKCSTTSV